MSIIRVSLVLAMIACTTTQTRAVETRNGQVDGYVLYAVAKRTESRTVVAKRRRPAERPGEAVQPAQPPPAFDANSTELERYFLILKASGTPRPKTEVPHPPKTIEKFPETELLSMIGAFARPRDYKIDPFRYGPNSGEFTVTKAMFREDAAFKGMGKIASDVSLNALISAEACKVLGEVKDTRASAELAAIARGKSPENFRLAAIESLGRQMNTNGDVTAADALATLAESTDKSAPVEAARALIAKIGRVDSNPASLRVLATSKSKLIHDAAQGALDRARTLDTRLPEEDVWVMENLKAEQIDMLDQSIARDESEAASVQKAGNKIADGPMQIKTLRERISKNKAEQNRISRTKPLDFGLELMNEFDQITNCTKTFSSSDRFGQTIDEQASRFPLVRYNVPGEQLGPDGKSSKAFLTIDVVILPQYTGRIERLEQLDESLRKAEALRSSLARMSTAGLFAVKKAFLLKATGKSGGAIPAPNSACVPPLGGQESELKQFFAVINQTGPEARTQDQKRKMLSYFGNKPDLAYEHFTDPATALRTDAAFAGMKAIITSPDMPEPLVTEAITALSAVNDIRACDTMIGIVDSSASEALRRLALKGLAAQMAVGSTKSAEALARVAETSTDGPTKSAAMGLLTGLKQSNAKAEFVFNYYKSENTLLKKTAKEVLVARNALDDRLSEDDLKYLAIAREWRNERNKTILASWQTQLAAIKAKQAGRPDPKVVIYDDDPSQAQENIREAKADIERTGRLKPLEFGIDLMELLMDASDDGKYTKDQIALMSKSAKTYDQWRKESDLVDVKKVTYERPNGSRYTQNEWEVNTQVLTGMIGSIIAKNAIAKSQRYAAEMDLVVSSCQKLMKPLSQECQKQIESGWKAKYFKEHAGKK